MDSWHIFLPTFPTFTNFPLHFGIVLFNVFFCFVTLLVSIYIIYIKNSRSSVVCLAPSLSLSNLPLLTSRPRFTLTPSSRSPPPPSPHSQTSPPPPTLALSLSSSPFSAFHVE